MPTPQLPYLHNSASNSSQNEQRIYTVLLCLNLSSLIIASICLLCIKSWNPLGFIAACLLLLSVVISVLIRFAGYRQRWYAGRSVAESVKTLAWKYMMRSEPYSLAVKDADNDKLFIEDLKAIMKQESSFSSVPAVSGASVQITDDMRNVRNLSWPDRLSCYIANRLRDQQTWYSKKCNANQISGHLSFFTLIAVQIGAVAFAYQYASNPDKVHNIASVLSALASAIIAWINFRSYETLAQSYGIAAQELAMILSMSEHVHSEQELADFVSDAENAVSREHTLWRARRDQP